MGGQPAGGGGAGGAGGEAETCDQVLDDSLTIATTSVPDAWNGKDYDYSLVPLGGTHVGYAFELAKGTLPSGLALDRTGRIHGMAGSNGSSSFSVRLTDPDHHETTADFSLKVKSPETPRRWDISFGAARELLLVDNLHQGAPNITLTTDDLSASSLKYSPDGTMLVYVTSVPGADPESDRYELYLVRLVGDQPKAELLDTANTNVLTAWDSDSKRLAIASNGIRCAMVGADAIQMLEVDPGVWGPVEWLTDTTLGYQVASIKDKYRYSTLSNGAFSKPQDLDLAFGNPLVSTGNQLAYSTLEHDIRWIDFDSGATKVLGVDAAASPGLGLVAQNSPDGSSWQVAPLAGGDPLVSWSQTKPSTFVWSSERAVFALNDRLDIWRKNSAGGHRASLCVDKVERVGLFGTSAFSPDGTWLFFPHGTDHGRALSAVGIGGGHVLQSADVMLTSSSSSRDMSFSVSPDSRWLATLTQYPVAGKSRVALVRLRNDVVLTPQAVTLYNGGASVESISWAPDSSRLKVVGFVPGAGWQTILVDPSDPNAAQ